MGGGDKGGLRVGEALLWGAVLAGVAIIAGLWIGGGDTAIDLPEDAGALCLACVALGGGWLETLVCSRSLTPREVQVSGHVAFGWRNRELAEHLGLSARTVETHLRHVYSKVGIHSRLELALLAREAPPP